MHAKTEIAFFQLFSIERSDSKREESHLSTALLPPCLNPFLSGLVSSNFSTFYSFCVASNSATVATAQWVFNDLQVQGLSRA